MTIPKRVLVADQDEGVRSFIATILTQAGYDTERCGNERQVLEAFDPGVHGLLILEEEMFDLASAGFQELRARDPQVPIVLLYNGPGPSGPVQDQINVERVTKPFAPVMLIEAMKRLLS
jgi:DNA-binding response OmpR family regulator